MDKAKFDEYVDGRYAEQIKWYDKKARMNKLLYRLFLFSMLLFSILTPVLIGIGFVSNTPHLQWFTFLTSVIAALLSSSLKAFKFKEDWIRYRTAWDILHREIYLYHAGVREYSEDPYQTASSVDKEALFVEKIESVIANEHSLWLNTYGKIGKRRDEELNIQTVRDE